MSDKRPIIIKKAPKKHHGHHGGAWKVAYADFVTAMMAFFMVLWIMGMEAGAKEMIQGYFQNPVGFKKNYGGGSNPLSAGNSPQNLDVKRLALMARDGQRARFIEAIDHMRLRLEAMPELKSLQDQIDFVVTNEGLRIELLDGGSDEMFFESGSATMLPTARMAVEVIGQELAKLPNSVILEGHTDARQYGSQQYSNWELSVDRANSSRRALLAAGITSARIVEVRGYADRHLRVPDDPYDSSNRRISILLPFTDAAAVESAASVGVGQTGRNHPPPRTQRTPRTNPCARARACASPSPSVQSVPAVQFSSRRPIQFPQSIQFPCACAFPFPISSRSS